MPRILIVIFLSSLTLVNGQTNIVPNPSFESTVTCPSFGADWDACSGWNNVNMNTGPGSWGTPDYFHTCGTAGAAPPSTFAGTCNPQHGNAMMALVVYNVPYPNYREYVSAALDCAMKPGVTYTVSFWITNGTGIKSPWTVKNFGVYFSSSPPTQSGWNLINAVPQCEVVNNIASTTWSQYTFTLIPSATWNFLTLGVFRPDVQNNPTQAFPNPGGPSSAYANYFIDNISVLSPYTASTLAVQSSDYVLCEGQSATLTASGASSYTWSNGVTGPSLVVNPTVTTTYSLFAHSLSGCSVGTTTTSLTLIVNPKPNAEFDLRSTNCDNTVNVSTVMNNDEYLWTFGDGLGHSGPSYTHSYVATGIYTIALKAVNKFGCSAISSKTVAVIKFQPTVNDDLSVCRGTEVKLFAGGGTSYTWTPSSGLDDSHIPNPTANLESNTLFTVNIIRDHGYGFSCSHSVTTQVDILPAPFAKFDYTTNPCGGGVQFFDRSEKNIFIRDWLIEPTTTHTVVNPYHYYNKGGTYSVQLVVKNIYGCVDSIIELIKVDDPPPVSVNSPPPICKGSTVQLTATGGESYQWTPTLSVDFPGSHNPTAWPDKTTRYFVEIVSTQSVNGKRCVLTLYTDVQVTELSGAPVKAFAEPEILESGELSTLILEGDPGLAVTWLLPNQSGSLTGYSVITTPAETTTYTVIVQRGPCIEEKLVEIVVYDRHCAKDKIFVPNTFSPNQDGSNDRLFVRTKLVGDIYFAVYNRWGEKIFESNNKDTGWDGTYNGKAAETGVYGWYVKMKCLNGNESVAKGNVTLIR